MDYIIIDGTLPDRETVNELFYKHKKLKTRVIASVYCKKNRYSDGHNLRIRNDAGKLIIDEWFTVQKVMEKLNQT